MNKPVCLSLFDYSGAWSAPWRKTHEVVQVDIKHGVDILSSKFDLTLRYLSSAAKTDVILAAPPCTDFAVSGAQYWKAKDADGRTAASLALLDKTMAIIRQLLPRVWAIENPVGRINKLRPDLAQFGPWYFQPWQFGDPWTKKTGLWGNYDIRALEQYMTPVEPIRYTAQGSWTQKLGGKSERTKELRSVTPTGFARAFYLSQKGV